MSAQAFPFPDKISSREELSRDLLFKKIPEPDLDRISDKAWETGEAAASILIEKYANMGIEEIAQEEGLSIRIEAKDNVAGNLRYFSEYYSGKKLIVLYEDSIKKWASSNRCTKKEAISLILSHEFYHHLECTTLGLTSEQYKVPTLKIGKHTLVRSGIRALSEIGAHGFARKMFESKYKKKIVSGENTALLQNQAVHIDLVNNKNTVDRIFNTNPVLRLFSKK